MPNDLLIEIGCEELPSSFVDAALDAFPTILTRRLDALRIAHGPAKAFGSPRRIAVVVQGLADRQPDLEEKVMGPPEKAAFDASGAPTKGAEAFAKKLGIDASKLEVVDTPKGRYVAGVRREAGRSSLELVASVVRESLPEIPFRKSMRWGTTDVAFGRPIHWIVALLGAEVVSFEYAGAASGRTSRGHRFLSPGAIEIRDPATYPAQLGAAHVIADVDERKAMMLDRLNACAQTLGGTLQADEFLNGENVGLVEEPFVIEGSFDPAFLALPERLVLDVMRTHQRYFGVRDARGSLMPRYLAVVNTAKAPDVVRKGNDRVLRARLSDARFFVESDRKAGLERYREKLSSIRYHAKLGSVADKVARIGRTAAAIATDAIADESARARALESVAKAAALCKADLASLTVGEFPELQGYVGRDIAAHSGVDEEVARAIAEHYLNPDDLRGLGPIGLYLGLADKIDHLVGGFAVGLAPTGSNDPFSMRRAFNRAVLGYLMALRGDQFGRLPALLSIAEHAYRAYAAEGKPLPKEWSQIEPELRAFMKARMLALFDEGVEVALDGGALAGFRAPRDVVEACIEASFDDLRDLRARIAAIRDARHGEVFARLVTALKRASRITKDVPREEPDRAKFDHPAEKALWDAYQEVRSVIERAMASADYRAAIDAASIALADPMDVFFDKDRGVFVMSDDLAVRDNRLKMLATIAGALGAVAKLELLESPKGAEPNAMERGTP